MLRVLVVICAAALMLGCSPGAVDPVVTPPPAAATQATTTPERAPTEQARLAIENIEELYGSEPKADWYPFLHVLNDGSLDVSIDEDGWLIVGATLPDDADGKAVADSMCRDIAAAAYDVNAVRIGFTDVMIVNAHAPLGDCDVPDL